MGFLEGKSEVSAADSEQLFDNVFEPPLTQTLLEASLPAAPAQPDKPEAEIDRPDKPETETLDRPDKPEPETPMLDDDALDRPESTTPKPDGQALIGSDDKAPMQEAKTTMPDSKAPDAEHPAEGGRSFHSAQDRWAYDGQ
eukprot:10996552-Alexandrium_andersonii.AAC.1